MNTELDEKSYKGIAPIFTWGREPYPYPSALIIAEKSLLPLLLLYRNIVEWLLNVRIVFCGVAHSCSDIKAVLLPIAGCLLAQHYVIFLF